MVSMQQKFQSIIMSKVSDVQFVFELDSGVVKVPSVKDVLAASSPVFNAMFNGDLKEKGDVKIVDAPLDAFEEFLQFFYADQVKLTMNNIAYVMNLVNKYDVADCFPRCVEFLKENLTVDEALWALHLALKFQLDDLKALCESLIEKNIEKVMGMFELSNDGGVSLSSNPDQWFIPEKGVEKVFARVFAISRKLVSVQLAKIKQLREKCVFPITLSSVDTVETEININHLEAIDFMLNGSMQLTDIFFSHLNSIRFECDLFIKVITIKIQEKTHESSKIIFTKKITLKNGENRLKIEPPIILARYNSYSIIISAYDCWVEWTNKSMIPDSSVYLTKNTTISFPKNSGKSYKHSFIHRLHFQEIFED